jgi:hypothetical protein
MSDFNWTCPPCEKATTITNARATYRSHVLTYLSIGSLGDLALGAVFRNRVARINKEVALIVLTSLYACQPLDGATVQRDISTGLKGLRLEGVMSTRASGSGPTDPAYTNSFALVLSGCNFHVEADGVGGVYGAPQQSFSFDGTNYYHVWAPTNVVVTNFSGRSAKTRESNGGKPRHPPSPATITIGPLDPIIVSANILAQPWLALASKCYYENQESEDLIPPVLIGSLKLRSAQRLHADRSFDIDRLFITSYVDYWNENVFPKREPDCNGKTNIVCWITGWTNVESVEIPIGFEYKQFIYRPGENPKYYPLREVSGRIIRSTVVETNLSFTPTIASNAFIIHHSSEDVSAEPVTYKAKSGKLMDNK